jgi:hypothetical protein
MVASDRNDNFGEAAIEFLKRTMPVSGKPVQPPHVPGSLSTRTLPPRKSSTERTTAKPRPAPSPLCVISPKRLKGSRRASE